MSVSLWQRSTDDLQRAAWSWQEAAQAIRYTGGSWGAELRARRIAQAARMIVERRLRREEATRAAV